jgi:hypothetical protein
MAKAKVGRPTDYKPEYCEQLIEHMKQLHSFESFAADVNTTRATLYNWCKDYPEFLDARKRGREHGQKGLENIGKGLFTGKIKGNVAAWIFFMKNMTNWRDDTPAEIDEIEGLEFI